MERLNQSDNRSKIYSFRLDGPTADLLFQKVKPNESTSVFFRRVINSFLGKKKSKKL
jgi:hypothetical protein